MRVWSSCSIIEENAFGYGAVPIKSSKMGGVATSVIKNHTWPLVLIVVLREEALEHVIGRRVLPVLRPHDCAIETVGRRRLN